jgi:hypothetical protein
LVQPWRGNADVWFLTSPPSSWLAATVTTLGAVFCAAQHLFAAVASRARLRELGDESNTETTENNRHQVPEILH